MSLFAKSASKAARAAIGRSSNPSDHAPGQATLQMKQSEGVIGISYRAKIVRPQSQRIVPPLREANCGAIAAIRPGERHRSALRAAHPTDPPCPKFKRNPVRADAF